MTTHPAAMRAADTHATQTKSPITSPTKTPRRVLGDLTPNARPTPQFEHPGAKSPTKAASPIRAQQALQISVDLAGKENEGAIGASGSRKRPFSAIESPRRRDALRSPAKRQHGMMMETVSPAALRSPMPPPVVIEGADDDDSESDGEESHETATAIEDDHIEVPGPSQRTVGSFSSLIDYNPDNASEKSDPASTSPASARSESIPVTSRVELLKLRLKMAMYKINTNQTMVPFSKLEIPHEREPLSNEEAGSKEEEDALPGEEKSAASGNIVITGGPIAKLLAGPMLAPTAFSARFVDGPGAYNSPPRRMLDRQMTPAGSPTRRYAQDERDLTSSVVKGHAASGLLELANAK